MVLFTGSCSSYDVFFYELTFWLSSQKRTFFMCLWISRNVRNNKTIFQGTELTCIASSECFFLQAPLSCSLFQPVEANNSAHIRHLSLSLTDVFSENFSSFWSHKSRNAERFPDSIETDFLTFYKTAHRKLWRQLNPHTDRRPPPKSNKRNKHQHVCL